MTQEDKDLLFKDLCARLPYHPKAEITFGNTKKIETLKSTHLYSPTYSSHKSKKYEVKLFLRPMSSMTEEEVKEFAALESIDVLGGDIKITSVKLSVDAIDWLNSHHFDYRGLIEKGLALEAKEGMYK